jgi:putative membrane protein
LSADDSRHRDPIWAQIVRWRGIALAAVAIVVTLWLALTNQLTLYINPNYIVFTAFMAVVALALLIASFVVKHGHSHDEVPTQTQKAVTIIGAALTLLLAVAMVVVPPATLSSATALQRDVNSTAVGASSQTVAATSSASNATFEKFTVIDWSALLQQTSEPSFYQGKPANVVGFVTSDSTDPANLFYVTRFVITCCAVDAQPVGVPVYLPYWKQKYPQDKWVKIAGGFVADPSKKSSEKIALVPSAITVVATPSQPYLF